MATPNTPVSADVEAAARSLALVARMAADDLGHYARAFEQAEMAHYAITLRAIVGDLEHSVDRYNAVVANARNGVER